MTKLIDTNERRSYNDVPIIQKDERNSTITISGNSIPEDAADFYLPFIRELDHHLRVWDKIEFNFRFKYYNTATTRYITAIILKLLAVDKYKSVTVNWYYPVNDTDMEESGLDYKEMYEFRNFNLVPIN